MRHFGDSTLNFHTTLAYKVKLISKKDDLEIYSDVDNATYKGFFLLLISIGLFSVAYYLFTVEHDYTAGLFLTILPLVALILGIKLLISKGYVSIDKFSKKINIVFKVLGKEKKNIEYSFSDIEEVRVEYVSNQRGRIPLSYQKKAVMMNKTTIQHYPEVTLVFNDKKSIIFLTPWSEKASVKLAESISTFTDATLNNCLNELKKM